MSDEDGRKWLEEIEEKIRKTSSVTSMPTEKAEGYVKDMIFAGIEPSDIPCDSKEVILAYWAVAGMVLSKQYKGIKTIEDMTNIIEGFGGYREIIDYTKLIMDILRDK